MTLISQIQTDVASVFLNTSDFAEQVIQYVRGDDGNRSAITAVVDLQQPSLEKNQRGRGYETRGTVIVDDAVAVNTGDAFDIRGDRYEVQAVKTAEFGAKEITVVRYASEARGVKTAGDI